ncbi:hypothetical protein FGG08_000553 [Glutinoglossum americanum]|uniref:3'(2'),5'-bisphosphate nucleotidase n=1 Tax=Glutinoglossum americanum TaxID=1670608 RepID=A0A9P8L6U2_9PEZI|nr:hypothetical protein FGG08_000553 [Glutinoglossum americanum]
MDRPYATEHQIAILAVHRASLLTQIVLKTLDQGHLSKPDKSPVTIADFGSQALLISAIHHSFPDDTFVGEENASVLRGDARLRERVWELVCSVHLDGDAESAGLLPALESQDEMLDAIDLGVSTRSREGRVWVLDPVDGTADFMRGGQYAVSLALLEDGVQRVGVVGCPNLDAEAAGFFDGPCGGPRPGVVVSAVAGQGAAVRPMSPSGALLPPRRLPSLPDPPPLPASLRFVDSFSSPTTSLSLHAAIVQALGAPWPPRDLDSLQLRCVALALGRCDAMIRIPHSRERRDWIWDYAGGVLIAEEVGVKFTDAWGKRIDFGTGRKLEENFGWVVAHEGAHGAVLEVVLGLKGT